MPNFNLLKSLMYPEQTSEDTNSYMDLEKEKANLEDYKYKMRTGKAPSFDPGEAPLEDTDAPYEYLGPAEVKAAATGLAKGVPMAAGVLLQSRKEALQALKNAMNPETKLIDRNKLIKNIYGLSESAREYLDNFSKLHGTAILEATGKPETVKGMKEASEVLSPMTKDIPIIHRTLKGNYGLYNPQTKTSTITTGLDPLLEMSAIAHENVGHGVEHKLMGLKGLNKTLPYTEQKTIPDMAKDPVFLSKIQTALEKSPMFKEALAKKFKTSTINLSDPKVIEYLNTLNFWDDPQRLLYGLTGEHNIFYPLNLEAEQAAQVMNRAIQNEPLNLDPEFIRMKALLKKQFAAKEGFNVLKGMAKEAPKVLADETGAIGSNIKRGSFSTRKIFPTKEELLNAFKQTYGNENTEKLPENFLGKTRNNKTIPSITNQKFYKVDPELGLKSNAKRFVYNKWTPEDNLDARDFHQANSSYYFHKMANLIKQADDEVYGFYKSPTRKLDYFLGEIPLDAKYSKEAKKEIEALRKKYLDHQNAYLIHDKLTDKNYYDELVKQLIAEGGEY